MAGKQKKVTDAQRVKSLMKMCLGMAADPEIPKVTHTRLAKLLIKEVQRGNIAAGVSGKGACRIYHNGDVPTCYGDLTRQQCEEPSIGGIWEEGGHCP